MRCAEFEERVQRILDGEALPAESAELRAHGQSCPACAELLGAARQLQRGLALMPRAAVPEHFADGTVRLLLQRPRFAVAGRWWLAAAASLLLAAGGAFWLVHSLLESTPSNRVAERPASPKEPGPRPPSLREELAEAGAATLQWTRGFARDAADHAGILVPPGDLLKKPALPAAMEPDVTPLREAGRTVASGLQPVTSSARRAWSMLMRDLPFSERNTP